MSSNEYPFILKNVVIKTTWQERVDLYRKIDRFLVSQMDEYPKRNIKAIPFIPDRISKILENFKVELVKAGEAVKSSDQYRFTVELYDRKTKTDYRLFVGEFNGVKTQLF